MANIGVICGANDTISIIFNFIALAIIAEFDNYVYASMKGESFKALCEKEFTKKKRNKFRIFAEEKPKNNFKTKC